MPLWLQFTLFLSVSVTILGAVHYYLWRRLARDTGVPRRWRHPLRALVILGAVSFPLERLITRAVGGRTAIGFAYFAYGWMGFCLYAFLLLVAIDATLLLAWPVRRLGRGGHDPPPDPGRRRAIRRLLGGGVALASGGIITHGARAAFAEPEVTSLNIALPRLPRALAGLTLVQLSDIHVGPIIREPFVRRLVALTNRLRPDLVVITGDLFDREAGAGSGDVLATLRGLRSRFGTYFVTGNHEYYVGADAVCRALRETGIVVLRNQRVAIGEERHSFDLIGVDDWSAHGHRWRGYDLAAALAGRDRERAAVLLAHQPRGFEAAVDAGVGLQLSGHTHGGQMFPLIGVSKLIYPYVAGHYRHGAGHIYVSRGAGFWGPPFRVLAPPEIVHVVLV